LEQGCELGCDGEDKQRAAVCNLLEQTSAAEAASVLPAYILSSVRHLVFPTLYKQTSIMSCLSHILPFASWWSSGFGK